MKKLNIFRVYGLICIPNLMVCALRRACPIEWVMRRIWAFFAKDENPAFCVGFSHRQLQVSEITNQES
jgi:hypothetical protein